jgi:hypothetical protein
MRRIRARVEDSLRRPEIILAVGVILAFVKGRSERRPVATPTTTVPERPSSDGVRATVPRAEARSPKLGASESLRRLMRSLDPLTLVPLVCALGVLVVAVADNRARVGLSAARPLFWSGYLMMVVPTAALLTFRAGSRASRVVGVISLAAALYLVKVIYSPLSFAFHDEFGHWRTADAILTSGGLFTRNPLLSASPFYPGLETVATALASLGGISIFSAGLIVVGVAHVLLVGALYLLYLEATASNRLATLAACLYMANPGFLYFDAQFAYESFGLALAVACVLAVGNGRVRTAILALLLLTALVATHHLTTYATAGLLIAWGALAIVLERGPQERRFTILGFGLATALGALLWAVLVAPVTAGYLGGPLGDAADALTSLFTGELSAKRPFTATEGYSNPQWERLVAELSIFLVLVILAVGFVALMRARRRTPLVWALCGVALLYPIMLLPRLAREGTEISNRSGEFVFLGVAFLAAIVGLRVVRPLLGWTRPFASTLVVSGYSVGLMCLFVGGLVIGWSPVALQPGPYIPGANSRSVDVRGNWAAAWARTDLPPGERIATDSANALTMGSYGRQNPQGGWISGRPVSEIFTSRSFSEDVRRIIVGDQLRYLVVDERLASGLPANGVYFYDGEPNSHSYERPISLVSLQKFQAVRALNQVFSDGKITVYDASPLLR